MVKVYHLNNYYAPNQVSTAIMIMSEVEYR